MADYQIKLPFFNVNFSYVVPDSKLILATGGRTPELKWLAALAEGKRLWCVDHGIDYCCEAGLFPERLIGDGDSAQRTAWEWARSHHAAIAQFPPEKDYTDTQLALQMAAGENAFIILTGAFGGRFDHGFSTAFSFAHSKLQGILADDKETMLFLKAGEAADLSFSVAPKAISLMSFSEKVSGVDIDNVKWPLSQAALTQNFPYSISNELEHNPVHVHIEHGILGIYICWDEEKIIQAEHSR